MPLTGAEYRRVASRGALLARAQSELAACDPEGFEAVGIVDRRLEAERGDRADTRHARFGDGPLTKEHPDGQDTRAALRPSKATYQILPSMDKDINDDTRIGPNENVAGDEAGSQARMLERRCRCAQCIETVIRTIAAIYQTRSRSR